MIVGRKKMRLIDADKLDYMLKLASVSTSTSITDEGLKLARSFIKDMPTVKAIPIKWMKKFANERALNDGMDCYWHFWGEDLLQMIEQWEKANEHKESD